MRHLLLKTLVIAALAGGLAACSGGSGSEKLVKVEHGPTPAVVVDLGDPGSSVGDQRYFHFDATSDGAPVTGDATMLTTGSVDGVESRVLTLVFTFADPADQLVLQGAAQYAAGSATFKTASTVTRSIVGGSGKYAGARGYVVSTHKDDDTWIHEFHLLP